MNLIANKGRSAELAITSCMSVEVRWNKCFIRDLKQRERCRPERSIWQPEGFCSLCWHSFTPRHGEENACVNVYFLA